MISLKKTVGSKPIATITGGEFDGQIVYLNQDTKKKIIYVKGNDQLNDKLNKEMKITDGEFFVYPDIETRETIYCAGPSGSGKSTWMGKYAKVFKSHFKKPDIYIFTKIQQDKAIDPLKPVRIPLDDRIVDEPVQLEELKDSLVIFDDIDSINDKAMCQALEYLQNNILECGRHENIYVLSSRHQMLEYKKTRCLLNESTMLVVFIKSGSSYIIKQMLKNYCGFDKNVIDRIFKLESRWVAIHKSYPIYVASEHEVFLV